MIIITIILLYGNPTLAICVWCFLRVEPSTIQHVNHRGVCAAYCSDSDPATLLISPKWSVVVVSEPPHLTPLTLACSYSLQHGLQKKLPIPLPFGLQCYQCAPTSRQTDVSTPPFQLTPVFTHQCTHKHLRLYGCSQKKWSPPPASVVHTGD